MFNLEKYPQTVKLIDNMFKNKRLTHAYLIHGGVGTPKRDLAYYMAMKFYCEDVCLNCNNCRNIMNNQHPNVVYITNDGQNIKKEQIANLIQGFSKSSIVDGPRIYIIDNVELMNKYSANSLLKFIEEPTIENTYGILTTNNLEAVLPTIKSRCQIISVKDSQTLDIDIPERYKKILENITNDSEEAMKIYNSESFEQIVEVVNNVYKYKKLERINYIKDYYQLLKDKDNVVLFIKISIMYFMDVVLLEHGISPKIFDVNKELDAYKNIEILNKLQNSLRFNINYILAIESFLLEGE